MRLIQVNVPARRLRQRNGALGGRSMTIHKQILEWQAAHPIATWIGWGIIWMLVFIFFIWPRTLS
jgi:hypothetical protein